MDKKIAFDIDGVIFDIYSPVKMMCERHLKRPLNESPDYDMGGYWGIPRDIMIDFFSDIIMYNRRSISIYDGMIELINGYIRLTDEPVTFISARHDWWRIATESAISERITNRFELITTDDKISYLKQNNFTHLVDDCLETCRLCVDAGIAPLMPDRSWNKGNRDDIFVYYDVENLKSKVYYGVTKGG